MCSASDLDATGLADAIPRPDERQQGTPSSLAVRKTSARTNTDAEPEVARARLVEAADEARRRRERDLHDGAQQHLVLASITLGRAREQVRGTPAEPLIAEASVQLRAGLAALRELAHGIYPTVLYDRGLAPALEDLALRSPVPVELRVTNERATPGAEAAIYFTVAEALTNVAKHAQATVVSIEVDGHDGVLVATVADNGVGGANPAAGSGLHGLADRLDALGGALFVESPAGGGTTIRAQVARHERSTNREAALLAARSGGNP
jgi:signal transduction histidine kinase